MRYAVIEDNKVIDIVTADESYYPRLQQIFSNVIQTDNITAIGWYYVNNNFQEYMQIAELTIDQHRMLVGKKLNEYNTYSPIILSNGGLAISDEAIAACDNEELTWLQDLPLIDYATTLPDTTLPTMSGYGVVIPTEYLGVFPNNEFKCNGFIVTLSDYGNEKAVDTAYLQWAEFQAELDRKYNEPLKQSLMFLWDYCIEQIMANNIVEL